MSMAVSLIVVPLVLAGLVALVPSNRWRPWFLPAAGLVQLGQVIAALRAESVSGLGGWLVLDPLGKVLLGLVSVLFFFCSIYTASYLTKEASRSNRVFCACLLLSLSMMTLVILSHHLGLLWVAMEATTLSLGPNPH